jgi:hypothetical protein
MSNTMNGYGMDAGGPPGGADFNGDEMNNMMFAANNMNAGMMPMNMNMNMNMGMGMPMNMNMNGMGMQMMGPGGDMNTMGVGPNNNGQFVPELDMVSQHVSSTSICCCPYSLLCCNR